MIDRKSVANNCNHPPNNINLSRAKSVSWVRINITVLISILFFSLYLIIWRIYMCTYIHIYMYVHLCYIKFVVCQNNILVGWFICRMTLKLPNVFLQNWKDGEWVSALSGPHSFVVWMQIKGQMHLSHILLHWHFCGFFVYMKVIRHGQGY